MTALSRGEPIPPFRDPLEPRVLPRNGSLFWTLNTPRPGGRLAQRLHTLQQLDPVLREVRTGVDTYMSQGLFAVPCRRAIHLACLTHAYVDLDLYKVPGAPRIGAGGIMLRQYCRDEGIPEPSLIVSSGRGVYLKWNWSSPIPRAAAGRAVAVNRALVKRFAEWGADPQAVDVSRLLRVVGTTNSKSGTRVEILWQAERDGAPLTYDFDLFADEVLPYTLEQIRRYRAGQQRNQAEIHLPSHERGRRRGQDSADERRRSGARVFVWEDWHWGVLEDIRSLIDLRHNGLVPRGPAAGAVGVDLFGHLGACQLARVIPSKQLWPEIQAWAGLLLPRDYVDGVEFRRHCSTLLANARRAVAGETVEFEGRRVAPIYTYRKATMIDMLQITSDEMKRMKCLIDHDEKRHRDREATRSRRRVAGVKERGIYEAEGAERSARAQQFRESGMTWAEVAHEMDLPSADAARQLVLRGRRREPYGSVPTSTSAKPTPLDLSD